MLQAFLTSIQMVLCSKLDTPAIYFPDAYWLPDTHNWSGHYGNGEYFHSCRESNLHSAHRQH